MSGLELLKRIKEQNPQVEVVIITGYGSKESVLEALRLGAYAFIIKPFDTIELLHTVANCLGTIKMKTQIDRLVVDLHDNRRELARTESRPESQSDQPPQQLDLSKVINVLDEAASQIDLSANSIWNDAKNCRRRGPHFLEDVSRLVSTCARETRKISGFVSQLESLTRDIDYGGDRTPAPPPVRREGADLAEPETRQPAPRPEPKGEATHPDPAPSVDLDTEPIYKEMQQVVLNVLTVAQNNGQIPIESVRDVVSGVVEQPGAVDALYGQAISSGTSSDWDVRSAVVTHSVNVAIYALKMFEGLGYTPNRMVDLGIAALIHAIGMVSLPDELYTKEVLDSQDKAALRAHPLKGQEYLSGLGDKHAWLTEVILQEHEREDGSGYPKGLSGPQIREEAKVIGLLDTYAGLVQSRPDRRGLTPFEAVKEITQTQRARFHPKILRALLMKLSAFPIGSLVRLNSGIVARVSQTFDAYPLRPVVIPLTDSSGWAIEEAGPLSLRENPILHISGVVADDASGT